MEVLFLRFTHLGENIFEILSNENLVKCREVARSWNDYLEKQKFLLIRIIKATILPFHDIGKSWQMVFSKAPTTTILEIDHAVQRFYQKDSKLIYNQGMTPSHVAAASGSLSLFKRMERKVQMKNPKDSEGFTPLHIAAQNNNFEVLKYIIDGVEEKCPVDNDGWTPLHSAAKRGHFEMCKYLLDFYNDKNPRANNGFTPLHLGFFL